jgi:16S rRNA processing protein RimM
VNRRLEQEKYIVVGRISGLYGVQGWLKIYSHTAPKDNILSYSRWFLDSPSGWSEVTLTSGRPQGKTLVAKLKGYNDRDQAAELINRDIALPRSQLPELESDEFYWADLEGLRVVTQAQIELGQIDHLFETGSNDVMVVKGDRERLIPFIRNQVVFEIDLAEGYMIVDWDPAF